MFQVFVSKIQSHYTYLLFKIVPKFKKEPNLNKVLCPKLDSNIHDTHESPTTKMEIHLGMLRHFHLHYAILLKVCLGHGTTWPLF
jgi:hypothetical protein